MHVFIRINCYLNACGETAQHMARGAHTPWRSHNQGDRKLIFAAFYYLLHIYCAGKTHSRSMSLGCLNVLFVMAWELVVVPSCSR